MALPLVGQGGPRILKSEQENLGETYKSLDLVMILRRVGAVWWEGALVDVFCSCVCKENNVFS